MTATYEPIATTTLGSNASSTTFSSISGSYTDLVIVSIPAQDVAANGDLCYRFNSDTGNNYSWTYLTGDGSAAASSRASNQNLLRLEYYAYPDTTVGKTVQIAHIMNYSNTTTYKTAITRSNSAPTGVDAAVGLWRSTSAITSVTVLMNTGNFITGSTFTLYGIKAE
jgi:hypothetical protein